MQESRPTLHAVALELTRYCNQKCDYCYNAWRDEPGSEAAGEDRWTARVDRLLQTFEIDHFTLTGGEPFAYRGVLSLIERIRSHGVGVQMISNGGLITEALAERLAPLNLRFIQITLNGPERELHEEHVGPDCFDKTVAGIRALRKWGVPVVGCIVVTRKNAAHVGAILARFRELGVRQIALSRFSPAGYASQQVADLLPGVNHVTEALEQAEAWAAQGHGRVQSTMPLPPCAIEVERFPHIGTGVCAIGTPSQEFAVGPDGRLRNCTLHDAVLAEAGDIADPAVDLLALVRHDDVTRYRKRAVPAFCRGCQHESTCNGGCGAAARWIFGELGRSVDPFVAQHVDDAFARRLRQQRRRLAVMA
jgi:radical SAM protein with 4Fe4S-binding SPASM domain